MLGPGRYLLGVAEILLLVGFAWVGATTMRRRWVAELRGATAQLATAVIAVAILVWIAELLGSFAAFAAVPFVAVVIGVGVGVRLVVGGGWGRPSVLLGFSPEEEVAGRDRMQGEKEDAAAPEGHPHPPSRAAWVALLIAALAVVHFAVGVKAKLSTGMTGFDSTWYHGPFAAGFFQSGDTWSLHFIAPQFLAWFYPANSEVLHAVGMLAFGRDVLSPLLNLGWFVGCLVAAWCIGRPYRVAPWSMGLAAIALSVPALHDQAGEARNDIVGIFFLLAAVAIALAQRERGPTRQAGTAFALGQGAVVGLAAGLATGTKLNFLLPALVLVVGVGLIAPRGFRWRAFGVAVLGALAGGGYWYLRNLAHVGNPLPWVKHLGPISLPAPEQALGGREGHSVLGYLTDGTVWSDWFLSGLHHGLTILWPLLVGLALAGLLLAAVPLLRSASSPREGEKAHRNGLDALALAGLTGLAVVVAWLIAPTSASGPDGLPRGFESGLRYLAPALVLGLALLPTAPALRERPSHLISSPLSSPFVPDSGTKDKVSRRGGGRLVGTMIAVLVVAVAVGYPVQRHYLRDRYANPSFTTPGLNAAFAWAQGVDHARIATTSTRQYPLFGRDLSNEVVYVGEERSHGGFTTPTTCRRWRELLNAGDYDYVVTSRDRIEPGKPPYPETATWTADPIAAVILRKPPTVVYKLKGTLDPSACFE
ncbi:MAG TPA: hypothetical protein VF245_01920 [Solirubrobacterales bacterium]